MKKKITFLLFASIAMVLIACSESKLHDEGVVDTQNSEAQESQLVPGALTLDSLWLGLDRADLRIARANALKTLNQSPDGVPQTWRNPKTGQFGRSTSIQTIEGTLHCRVLSSIVFGKSSKELAREKATYCQNQAGQWYIYSSQDLLAFLAACTDY